MVAVLHVVLWSVVGLIRCSMGWHTMARYGFSRAAVNSGVKVQHNHVEGRSTAELCAVGWRLMAVIWRVWAGEFAVHPRNKKCPIYDLGGA